MPTKSVQEWLQKADEDYKFAVDVFDHTAFYAPLCFHFQQAAEKYLKAFIVANDLRFRPIHDLMELLAICRKKQPKIAVLDESCSFLNPFYIESRYPVNWPTHYDKQTVKQAKQHCTTIRDWIKSNLK
ncbi:HEPN domain-containing protein [candidate division KSB1 bacterium]|nr:HEPN domain-containing protein [candidate division KSB1 bacterium]NIR69158.1 HEPN domain-containing protein [candidate division KSB1 bacterium]NIS25669.1 HEPN domain-containing protein [candidate division KSB1 bacterium]NIT72537.1 HEPN domain-containing protein [candidate division KSB1 bacterium]NIU26346.1 HEPN domain-containing protein [candidate division KSB1 bacterium]